MGSQRSDSDFPQHPLIEDGLFYPLYILIIAMLLLPVAAGVLFDAAVSAANLKLPAADAAAWRTGLLLIVQGAALVGLTVWRVTTRRGLGLPTGFLGLPSRGESRAWGQEVGVGFAAGIVVTALNIVGGWLTQGLFSLFMDAQTLAERIAEESGAMVEALGGGASGWIMFFLPVMAVVVAPITEELFFRGYLYAVLRSRFPQDPWPAAFWSSAVFALVHFYIIHFIPVFLIGVALAHLYRRRGSLIAPVVAHATSNLVIVAVTLIQQTALDVL